MPSLLDQRDKDSRHGHASVSSQLKYIVGGCRRQSPEKSTKKTMNKPLLFDSNFECGNLGKVACVDRSDCASEYDISIRPDTRNGRQRIWWYFRVKNAMPEHTVLFNIVNSSKDKSCYRDGMTPVVRSTMHPKWTRLPTKALLYYKDPTRRSGYVASFTFTFNSPEDIYEFAYCFPYTFTQLQEFLGALTAKRLPFVTRERLTNSLEKRRVDLLTIGDACRLRPLSKRAQDSADVQLAFISARVHPGETPSSFVLEGLINFLISDDVDAVRLREKVVFKIVPMINPDGVVAGNYRCGSMGHDLNRCYQTPKKWCQPEVHAIKKLLAELSQNCPKRLLFYLDLHAHTTSLSSFLYGNWYKNEGKMVSQWVFPHLMAAHADDFSLDNTDFNSHKAKAGTGRRALMQVMHSTAQIYTLEVSFYGYPHPGDPTITVPYSEERYRQLGAAVGRALADYYS
eukprot:m.333544 g.333544  ORF g.333544 m.333544 type:complete len:455 (-) comp20504_c0_seq32:749-2113(-)